MLRGLILIAGVACQLPTSALADWQYTRWGMSPKEVIAASKGAATETTLDQRKGGGTKGTEALLQAPYTSGKFQFRAMFNFSKKRSQAGIR